MSSFFDAPHVTKARETADLGSRAATAVRPGRVQLRGPLGAGRHGNVFEGIWSTDGTTIEVAVKVSADVGGLADEAEALRRFTHPGIIDLIASPDDANGVLVVGRCERGSLADVLVDRDLDLAEARGVVETIAGALQHLHIAKHIHGDVNPANIGVHDDGSVVLFDFATARIADGSAMPSGTKAFSGPLRAATIELDVRCLTATALATVNGSTPETAAAIERLEALIERCDRFACIDEGREDPVSLGDVIHALGATASKPIAPGSDLSPDLQSGGPVTRDYGPRPDGEDDPEHASSTSPDPGVGWRIAILIAVVLIGAAWVEFADGSTRPHVDPSASSLRRIIAAEESLRANDAQWDVTTGVLQIERQGEVVHLGAGEEGDLAAIGDWNCNGSATLGVYRPATATWFEFDSWAADATSTVARLESGTRLAVQIEATGCAMPIIRD